MKSQAKSLLIIILCMFSFSAYAAEDMHKMDTIRLIEQVSKKTGDAFIIDSQVRGQTHLNVDLDTLNNEETISLLNEALLMNNYGLIKKDHYFLVVPTNQLRNLTTTIDTDGSTPGNEIVTAIIEIKQAKANDLISVLRPVIAKYGHIAPISINEKEFIVLVDHADRIREFRDMIEKLDSL